MSVSMRRVRDVISIKRTIWSDYEKFRTLGVFYLERNEVLKRICSLSEDEIAKIASDCREGGVRWKGFSKFLTKAENALLAGREAKDFSQTDEKGLVSVGGTAIENFITVHEQDSGVSVSFNVNGRFDVLAKGNRSGCFEVSGMNITPDTQFTVVNELIPFWEDRYSLAVKGENFSAAISAEDPKTGKKGGACIRIYVVEGENVIIDDLGKYIDTSALTLWVTP